MPIYTQTWRQQDYVPRKLLHLRDLPKNHMAKLASVKFQFNDYKVYNQLACFPYERMLIQCFNNYGIFGGLKNMQCNEIAQFFKTCLQTNAFFGKLKKTQPQFFLENEYSRQKPTFKQLGL